MKNEIPIPFNINYLHSFLENIIRSCIGLILLFIISHKIGFVTRCIHKFAESELKKICNSANVTIGKLEVDIIHGHATFKDLEIQSPNKEEWEWDSPLIVRVGKIHVHFNLISVVDPLAFYFKTWPLRDIYGGVVEDVHVFVERRRNIFNFHLLDRSLDIPNPKDVMQFYKRQEVEEVKLKEAIAIEGDIEVEEESTSFTEVTMPIHAFMSESYFLDTNSLEKETSEIWNDAMKEKDNAEKEADGFVNSLLDTISSAAAGASVAINEEEREESPQVIRSRTDTLVNRLKQLQTSNVKSHPQSPVVNDHPSWNSIQSIATETLQVITNIHKTVERNMEEMKQQVDAFTKPPPKKADWNEPTENPIRIGYLIIKDIHIFTKGVMLTSQNNLHVDSISIDDGIHWNTKPIYLKEFSLSAAELAPPSSSRDEVTGLPSIGRTPDKIVDTILKKFLIEIAKTNVGRVFETALSEIFAWMQKTELVAFELLAGFV